VLWVDPDQCVFLQLSERSTNYSIGIDARVSRNLPTGHSAPTCSR